MRDRADIYYNKLIKRRENYYWKKRNHNNETVFMKIDFIEYRKEKNFKDEQRKRFKDEKKSYNYDKKGHFARDCQLKNKKNWQKINVLIKGFW